MQRLNKKTLRDFWERHPQAQRPLTAWYQAASSPTWSSPTDIKAAFGASVDFVADNRVVFDIAGNKYRLVVLSAIRSSAC